MPPLTSMIAPFIVVAGLMGLWLQTPVQSTTSSGVSRSGPVQPVAALAWAQANCNSMLTARRGTPRVQAEDLMRVASMYDTMRTAEGVAAACRQASAVAARVAEYGTSEPRSVRSMLQALSRPHHAPLKPVART